MMAFKELGAADGTLARPPISDSSGAVK